jgi:hypothetical protein
MLSGLSVTECRGPQTQIYRFQMGNRRSHKLFPEHGCTLLLKIRQLECVSRRCAWSSAMTPYIHRKYTLVCCYAVSRTRCPGIGVVVADGRMYI